MEQIGKLDRRIVIQHQVETGRGLTGEWQTEWQTLITVWANRSFQSAGTKETLQVEDRPTSIDKVFWTIRKSSDSEQVTANDRILYHGIVYKIENKQELEDMRRSGYYQLRTIRTD